MGESEDISLIVLNDILDFLLNLRQTGDFKDFNIISKNGVMEIYNWMGTLIYVIDSNKMELSEMLLYSTTIKLSEKDLKTINNYLIMAKLKEAT